MIRHTYRRNKLEVEYYPNFLNGEDSNLLFNHLEKNVKWSKEITKGRRTNQNYADDGFIYSIKFRTKTLDRPSLNWEEIPILKDITNLVSDLTKNSYNSCFIQRYPNGNVGINPHRDTEVSGKYGFICGLSLGSTRTLTLGPPRYLNIDPIKIDLLPGSLYVLKPPTNDYWTHCIEKNPNILEPRISLTFRSFSSSIQ